MAKHDAAAIKKIAEGYQRDPYRLMDVVREVHKQAGYLSGEVIDEIAQAMGVHRVQVEDMASFYSFFDREPAAAFEKELGIPFGQTTPDGLISLKRTSCIGMCDQAPAAIIGDMVVTGLKPEDVPAIVQAIRKEKGQVSQGEIFPNAEVQMGLRQSGPVVLAPFENGTALRKALNMSPEQVIEEINKSKLRGRGGAGFPTGMKWNFCRKASGTHFIICNADEGEPGTFKDRLILSEAADLLFEGMTVAGYAIGAEEGLLYLRAEYSFLWPHLEQVLARRRRHGLLGQNVAGREGFSFDIRIQLGAGAYVCGEESSLIESLEGKRGAPRDRPPYHGREQRGDPVRRRTGPGKGRRVVRQVRYPGLYGHEALVRLR